MSPRAFRDLVDKGVIEKAWGTGYDLFKVRDSYFTHLRKLIADNEAGKTKAGIDPLYERARKDKEAADRVALQNAATRAALVPSGQIGAVLTDTLSRFRRRLRPLPTKLAPRLVGKSPPEIRALLEEAIYAELRHLSEEKS